MGQLQRFVHDGDMRQINAALGQTIVTGDKGRRVLTPGVEQNVKLVVMLEQAWILNNTRVFDLI